MQFDTDLARVVGEVELRASGRERGNDTFDVDFREGPRGRGLGLAEDRR